MRSPRPSAALLARARAASPATLLAVWLAVVAAAGCTRILGINPWSTDAGPGDDVSLTDDAAPGDTTTSDDASCASPGDCHACSRTCNTVGESCMADECAAAACTIGFGNCNAMAVDGCETDLMTSSAHCGSCDRNCGGTACVGGVCEPTVFVSQDPFIASIVLRNGFIYWTNEDPPEIRRAAIGGGPSELVSPSTNTPWVLMADSAGIYWLALNGGPAGSVLKCTSPPCTSPTVLATSALGSDSPTNSTSDASRIYWSASLTSPGLRTVSKAGGNTTVVANEGDGARGMTLIQGVLYVTLCCGVKTGLYSVPATGGTATKLNEVMSGRLATFDNPLYTAESNTLYRVTTSGTMIAIDTASATIDDFAGLAVDASGIYAFSPSLGGIVRVPLAGGAPVLLSRATGAIQIVLDDSAVYWNENPGGFTMRAVKRIVK
jgi:hypothetical protein